jgi:hypothetical protein
MKKAEFNKLIKKYKNNLQKIIWLHCDEKINLTDNQIEEIIKLRGERIYFSNEGKK